MRGVIHFLSKYPCTSSSVSIISRIKSDTLQPPFSAICFSASILSDARRMVSIGFPLAMCNTPPMLIIAQSALDVKMLAAICPTSSGMSNWTRCCCDGRGCHRKNDRGRFSAPPPKLLPRYLPCVLICRLLFKRLPIKIRLSPGRSPRRLRRRSPRDVSLVRPPPRALVLAFAEC